MPNQQAKPISNTDIGERLSVKYLYGMGSIAYGVKDFGFRSLLLIYYNQVLGLPAGVVALAIMIALIVDAVCDPLIGQMSDSWESSWGRRHPFMYFSAVPAALAYLLLWSPPEDWTQTQLLGYLIVMAVLARSFISLYEIPSSSLISEFTSNYDERTNLTSFRYLFFFWGNLAISIFTFRVLFAATPEYPIGQLNPESYNHYGWIAAAAILISILVSTAGTHRYIPYLQTQIKGQRRKVSSALADMSTTLSNRSFLMILCASICKAMTLGISISLALYMNTYFWELSANQIAILILDSFFSAIIATWLTPKISRRFGKKLTIIWFYVLTYLVGVIPPLLRVTGLFFENGSSWLVPTLFVQGAIFGCFAIGSTILSASMIADCVEESQLKTGRRSEGLFFAASTFIQKAVGGFGVMASGIILLIVSFPDQAVPGSVSQSTLNMLVFITVPVTGIFCAVGSFCLSRYEISREKHETTLGKLALPAVRNSVLP